MHPFTNQELAHQHQEALLQEAARERAAESALQRIKSLFGRSAILQRAMVSEPDFAAIRRDLRSTLSEWSLEPGSANSEAALDTFMRCLKLRLTPESPE